MLSRFTLVVLLLGICSCNPMPRSITHVEAMSFRLKTPSSVSEFAQVNKEVEEFLSAQPGFVSRQLGKVNDSTSKADFERAFAASGANASVIKMSEMIEMESVQPFSFEPIVSSRHK